MRSKYDRGFILFDDLRALLIYKCKNDIYSNIHFKLRETTTTSWWYFTSWSHDRQEPSGCLLEFCFLFYFGRGFVLSLHILFPALVTTQPAVTCCTCISLAPHTPAVRASSPPCVLIDYWSIFVWLREGQDHILRKTKRHVLGLTST